MKASTKHSRWRRERTLRQSGGVCAICKQELELVDRKSSRFFTVDHIVPMCRGGYDVPDNWQAACRSCNLAKGGRRPDPKVKKALRRKGACQ